MATRTERGPDSTPGELAKPVGALLAAPTLPAPAAGARQAAPRHGPELARAALALVLALALGVRLWGLDWQLPWQFHPDEGHYTWKALEMIGENSLNPKYFRNPSLFTYLLYGQYRLLGFLPPKTDDRAATDDGRFRPPSGVALVG